MSKQCPNKKGDCDNDYHCVLHHVCGQDNCRDFWDQAEPTADCCIRGNLIISRVAKCQFLYTEQFYHSKFYPKKSVVECENWHKGLLFGTNTANYTRWGCYEDRCPWVAVIIYPKKLPDLAKPVVLCHFCDIATLIIRTKKLPVHVWDVLPDKGPFDSVNGLDLKLQRWSWWTDQDLMRETSLSVDYLSVTTCMMRKMPSWFAGLLKTEEWGFFVNLFI